MFRALVGGGRSSSDARSDSGSKSSRRRATDDDARSTSSRRSKPSASSSSHKSSRGDDRDRGLGDLSAYSSSGSRRRYAPSMTEGSVASTYVTAEPGSIYDDTNSTMTDRTSRYTEGDYGDDRASESTMRSPRVDSRYGEENRRSTKDRRGKDTDRDRDTDSARKERRRTRSGDEYSDRSRAPPTSRADERFAAAISSPGFSQFPGQYDTTMSGAVPVSPASYDPHVPQQFPGQFPQDVSEPYRPPHPAGEAAEYYGDQGESVAQQPGVRPKPPSLIIGAEPHLLPASPSANPPPEPSSMGQVGAAADYYGDHSNLPDNVAEQPSRPPKPSKPGKPNKPSKPAAAVPASALGAATYGIGTGFPSSPGVPYHSSSLAGEGPSPYYATPMSTPGLNGASHSHSNSHGTEASLGLAAAGAAAGYMMGHHSSSHHDEHSTHYNNGSYPGTSYGIDDHGRPPKPGQYGTNGNAALFEAAAAGAAGFGGLAAANGAQYPYAAYNGQQLQQLQPGSLAYHQRHHGPLQRFVNFWRDPEGVGMYEDYTEAIGVCRYCFEPGTSSRDAPRKHNYKRRKIPGDRYANGSRIEKTGRYSSEEENRRRRSKGKSWLAAGLAGGLAGYVSKSLFSNKDFDDTYSVRSGHVTDSRYSMNDSESVSSLGRKSHTSYGVERRSRRGDYNDLAKGSVISKSTGSERSRRRSRSRSRSWERHSGLRDAAIGVAIGSAAGAALKSRHRNRSRSPMRQKSRKSSSSSSGSYTDIGRSHAKSSSTGFTSFFSASSANRRKQQHAKQRKGFFSFGNSSASSSDADLAFGSAFLKKPNKLTKSNRSSGSSRSSKKKDKYNVDAEILGLGVTAKAIADAADRRGKHRSGVLVAKDDHHRRSAYTSSGQEDDEWEDADSSESSSSVSSALAYGGSALFGSSASDSGTSKWDWRWGSRKKKDKSKQSADYLPAAEAAAGALAGAAIASNYGKDTKVSNQDGSSSVGSLRRVYPQPTSDPSRYDAVQLPSRPGGEPQFVRPGPIPLQQPQPITPVSQSVYSTRAEPSPSYPAPSGPPVFADAARYDVTAATPTASGTSRRTSGTHRRSDSTPVFPIDLQEESLPSVLKRRTTSKDQASVQFELTKEQADKERRADRLEKQKRGSEYQESLRWAQEEEERKRDIERRRREKEKESGRRNEEYDARSSASRTDSEREKRRNDSSSWVHAAEGVAIGAAGAVIAEKISETSSERRQKRHEELRDKRRAERRRNSETEEVASRIPSTQTYDNQATSAASVPAGPVHENYGQFFAPSELRHGSNDRSSRAEERADVKAISELRRPSEGDTPSGPLPWSIPHLNVIEPTPPQSVNGSVRDTASPVVLPATVQEEEENSEDQKHERPGAGSRVSWGEHRTHEYEVHTPLSERSSGDVQQEFADQEPRSSNESVITSLKDEIAEDSKSAEKTQPIPEDVSGERVSDGFEDDIEFAATLAAGAAAAGFDPSVVTDDPTYHRRSSPPGSESKGVYTAPWVETVSDLQRPVPPVQGFVEGEVETPTDNEEPVEHIIDGKEFSAEPAQIPPEDDKEISKAAAERSIAREVIEKLNGKRDSWTEEPRRVSDSSPERPTDESNYVSVDEGPPTPKASEQQPKWDTESIRDESRSVASAPVGDSRKSRKLRRSVEDFDAKSETASLDDNDEKKKRRRRSKRDSEILEEERDESSRRRRKSHRDSGVFDDAGSVASSPAKIDETKEKRKSKDKESEKEKKGGGLFSSLFGSKASSAGEKSSSGEKDKRSSRDVRSEVGVDEYRHKKRSSKHRSSSGDNVLGMSNGASRSLTDLSQVARDIDRDDDREAGESPRFHRQRKEERRRQRYEDIVDSGGRKSDKDHKRTEDADEDQSFLDERPEMPVTASGDNGASGLDSFADVSRGSGEKRFSKQLRSSSESPVAGDKEVDSSLVRSRSRTVSVSPSRQRRLSAARPTDLASSPTAVPLHFRKPPTSPGVRRSASISSPVQSPSSPSQQRFGHRSRHSTEFKNAREFRPLWLVERHSSGKFEHQPDEPLPSLPSSKTSSRSTSVEDFKSLPSEDVIPSWQTQDVTQMMFDQRQRPMGLKISTKDLSEKTDHDLLGSQQATPTAETFSESVPSAKKEKPKYEFHSPSELLQDPCAFVPLPPSPTMSFLPSAEGSAVGTKEQENEGEIEHQQLPTLPESRPSSPTAGLGSTPTQEGRSISEAVPQSSAALSSLKEAGLGAGFGAIVDAAVSAASNAEKSKPKPTTLENEELPEIRIDLPTEEAKARGVDQLPPSLTSEQDVPVSADSSEATASGVDPHRPLSPTTRPGSRGTSPLAKLGGFGDVVDAAVSAAVKSAETGPVREMTSLGDNVETNQIVTVPEQKGYPTEKTDFASVVDAAVAAATGVDKDTKLPEQDEQLGNDGTGRVISETPAVEGIPKDIEASGAAPSAMDNEQRMEAVSEESKGAEKLMAEPPEELEQPPEAIETAPAPMSKKQKKKAKKAKKSESLDLTSQVPVSTPETTTPVTPATNLDSAAVSQESREISAEADNVPAPVDAHIEPETPVAQQVVNEPQEQTEEPSTPISSKKAKKDKNKKKGSTSEAQPEDTSNIEVTHTTSEGQVKEVTEADAETPKAQEELAKLDDETQKPTEEAPMQLSDEIVDGAVLGSAVALAEAAEAEKIEPVAPEAPAENAPTEVTPDDEWAEPSSKKSKKKKRKSKTEIPVETVAETGEKVDVEDRPDEPTVAAPEGVTEQPEEQSREQLQENEQEQAQEPPNETQSPETPAREMATEETVATPSTTENAVDDAQPEPAALSRKKSKKEKRKSKQAEKLAAESSAMVDQQDAPAIDNTEEKSVSVAAEEDAIQAANPEEHSAQATPEEAVSTPAMEKDAPESTAAITEAPEPAIEDKAEGLPDTVLAADTARPSEANAEELWEEQPKKSKKKGKKNRKSINLSESEQEPKQSDVVVDAAQAETPQPSGEAAETGRDVDHAAPAAAAEVGALEQLGAETVHREISSVEQNEANDRQPHVSPQIKPDFEPQDDSSGQQTSTGEDGEKDKNAEDPQLASQDEVADAPAAVTVAEADTAVVPIGEESPSDPAPPATEESKPIEDEPVKDAVVESAKEAIPEDEFPMTPAQKRKAKKDKKKRQSLKEEEAPAPETSEQVVSEPVTPAAEETPVVRDAPVEETPEEQDEVTPGDEPVIEPQESKDADGESVEEFQSAKSKKKAKKDKRRRQSLALSDEPPTPTTTEDLTEAGQPPAEDSATGGPAAAVEETDQLEQAAQEPSSVEAGPAAQEDQTVPEQPVPEAQAAEDIANEPVEEFSSAKSKKKAKKDKKKRQSLALEEEPLATPDIAEAAAPADEVALTVDSPSAPVVGIESTDQPSLEAAVAEAPASEEVPKEQPEEVTTTETKDESQPSEPKEENAQAEQDTTPSSGVSEGPQQATTEEPASPAVNEFQPAKSKKKGKKGKKNRASIDQGEEVQEETEKQPTAVDTTEQTKEEQPPSGPSLEQTTEASNAPIDIAEEKPTEEPREEKSDEPAVAGSEDVGSITAEREVAVVPEAAHEVPDNNDAQETQGIETEIGQNEQPDEKPAVPDVPPESTAELATEHAAKLTADGAAEAATEPATESKDQPALEAEPEAEFATSKSKKKSKKDKKKRQSADWTEEAPTATAEDVSKAEGEDNKDAVETDGVQAEETTEATPSTEMPAAEGDGLMSAKAKRKAKKDKKKRQSVTWEDEVSAVPPEPTAGTEEKPPAEADTTGDTSQTVEKGLGSVDENISAEEPKPADLFPPQETPAEDDGKEKQSSEENKTDDMKNETDWTDEMASSQAEQQKEMSPVPPHQPPSESTEPEISNLTPTTELDLGETTSEKEREEPKVGEEESKRGEDETATEHHDQETSWMTPTKKSKKDKKKKKRESASLVLEEPSTPTDASLDAGNAERSAPEQISSESVQPSESVPEDQPTIGTEDAGAPEPSNPEEPATATAEDLWPSTTSQKKKNKKDKKNKRKQELAALQEENANSPVEVAEPAPAETTET
ncbi:involucrin repeat protein, putative, partial [Paecilomyces variotii No. 5]